MFNIYIDALTICNKITEIRDNDNKDKKESINEILKYIDNMEYIKIEKVDKIK
jgi:hypothetical protein